MKPWSVTNPRMLEYEDTLKWSLNSDLDLSSQMISTSSYFLEFHCDGLILIRVGIHIQQIFKLMVSLLRYEIIHHF